MPAYSQLTHLLAARMDPGERELTNHDLRLIYGLNEITDAVRAEIVEDLRAAGVEVIGLDPLLVRKAAPEPVEPPAAPPKSKTPWLIAAGVVLVFAVLFALVPRGSAPSAAPAPVPRLKIHARGTATPSVGKPQTSARDIRPVEIAEPRTPTAELPCDTDIRSECESGEGAGGGSRRGR